MGDIVCDTVYRTFLSHLNGGIKFITGVSDGHGLIWVNSDLEKLNQMEGLAPEEIDTGIYQTSSGDLYTTSTLIPGHQFDAPVKLKDIPEFPAPPIDEVEFPAQWWSLLRKAFLDDEVRAYMLEHAPVMDPGEDERYSGGPFFLVPSVDDDTLRYSLDLAIETLGSLEQTEQVLERIAELRVRRLQVPAYWED